MVRVLIKQYTDSVQKPLFGQALLCRQERLLILTLMLIGPTGYRKYLTSEEWRAFVSAAENASPDTRTFCLVLALTGARLTEVRNLTPASIDVTNSAIVFECLKRRRKGIYRSVPVGMRLLTLLENVHNLPKDGGVDVSATKLWPWSRTTAWAKVKQVFVEAGLPRNLAMPKVLRHSFGVEAAARANVPLGTIKRWLGHSRLESTIVYCEAVGAEERMLARRMWNAGAQSKETGSPQLRGDWPGGIASEFEYSCF